MVINLNWMVVMLNCLNCRLMSDLLKQWKMSDNLVVVFCFCFNFNKLNDNCSLRMCIIMLRSGAVSEWNRYSWAIHNIYMGIHRPVKGKVSVYCCFLLLHFETWNATEHFDIIEYWRRYYYEGQVKITKTLSYVFRWHSSFYLVFLTGKKHLTYSHQKRCFMMHSLIFWNVGMKWNSKTLYKLSGR